MQLQPGERSILAYFTNQDDALKAVAELEALGFTDARADQISNYTRMGGGTVPTSISALTAASNNPEDYRTYGPLLAASPTVSGYANNESAHFTHMVALVTDASQADTAVSVLRNNGARV